MQNREQEYFLMMNVACRSVKDFAKYFAPNLTGITSIQFPEALPAGCKPGLYFTRASFTFGEIASLSS